MTALVQRIPNYDHEAHVLSVRRQMCAFDPLAVFKMREQLRPPRRVEQPVRGRG
jgi:hypothetical protein